MIQNKELTNKLEEKLKYFNIRISFYEPSAKSGEDRSFSCGNLGLAADIHSPFPSFSTRFSTLY